MLQDERRLCDATAKRTGKTCRAIAVTGSSKCRMHGGVTPFGPASPHFRTGRYSRFLPARLVARYREGELDPELLSLRQEIALVDACLTDLLARVDTGESGRLWDGLTKAFHTYRQARANRQLDTMRTALEEIESWLARGTVDHLAWAEISEKLEQRRKLCESEAKRLIAMKAVLNQQEALLLMGAITDIITRNVPDKRVLAQIVVELQQITLQNRVPVYAEATG
jgi:hypothetical protein